MTLGNLAFHCAGALLLYSPHEVDNHGDAEQIRMPDHTLIVPKINEILNWMANRQFCPSVDASVQEHQRTTTYVPPAPPSAAPSKKQKTKPREVVEVSRDMFHTFFGDLA